MRFPRDAFLSKRRKNQIRPKKKQKKLDAICERTYSENRVKIESPGMSEVNGDTSEIRRSSRVRRAPCVLDASPLPPKKRRKTERGGGRGSSGLKAEEPCSNSVGVEEEESGEWKARLRDRGSRKMKFATVHSSPKSKKKLFGRSDGKEQSDLVGNTLMVVKSKRPGRVKASSGVSNGDLGLGSSDKERDDTSDLQVGRDENKGSLLEEGATDNGAVVELPEQEKEVSSSSDSEDSGKNTADSEDSGKNTADSEDSAKNTADSEDSAKNTADSEDIAKNTVDSVEKSLQAEQAESGEKENHSLHQEVTSVPGDLVVNDTVNADHLQDENSKKVAVPGDTNHLQDENSKKVGEYKYSPSHRQHKSQIKKGRYCDLCGGGTEGKPPRKLLHDGAGSDNEAYSGSSSSEEPTYDTLDGFGDEPGWLGQLLGPINDRYGIAGIWVHQHCAVWSPEVYFAGLGCLKNVRSALSRGKVLKCSRCGRRGATIGCRVDRCPKTYHLPCARAIGCTFDHRKFLIACTDHRHLFQPHGNKFFDRLKKMKAKKIRLELRKQSNDSWRKDHEAEEKWLENCGEDEEFLKRESKRLHRDLARIAPVYIGGSTTESQASFQGWESVGGLQDVIQSLKEVVILPLLYPEFFNNMGLTPPRGVLLHGYPGTGKTLVVRSLIGACARGDKRIAYFARKGADCLGKYVGDAERQLRLLFQVAEKSQPSIIFFDEIDGLAPVRTRRQDQTHNSVVSTLLALLDGLKSRGSVVVIGATNRPDAIDPALRRPGRFDREIYFPLPSAKDREAILSLHTQKWPTPVAGSLLRLIARRTVGFAGADLQALCTQTAIIALKRRCPWDKLLTAAEEKGSFGKRPVLPSFVVQERDWLEALSGAPPPCSRREAGMAANDIVSAPLPAHLFPCMLMSLSRLLVALYLDERVCLPPSLSEAAAMIKAVIISALESKKENTDCWWSRVDNLIKEVDVSSDVESSLLTCNVLALNNNISGFDVEDDENVKRGPPKVHNGFMNNKLVHGAANQYVKKPGFCLLISGSARSGQRHLASCILHSFVGNTVLQKVDLATMLQEGAGDMVQGLTQILVRCASVGSCMIFMPRIDLWALETCHQVDVEEDCASPKTSGSSKANPPCPIQNEVNDNMESFQDPVLRSSGVWSSFVEQAESIFISASLTILATTEVRFEVLPPRIKDFFGKNESNLSSSNQMGNTVPRFSVHVDENFNHDMVIGSSATKLSNDVSRYFVELLHHKTHIRENPFIAADINTVSSNLESDTPIEYISKTESPSLPLNKKEEKGKSNLLLAISTFGYQILQYPHFAELCWVTSKLTEGPSAEIDGPWRGWPFNSCIVRPSDASEKVAVVSSSSNVKSKVKFGLVRGLVAVGLSAYRGVYSSLREVSADVRKVLEILTSQINAKVEGGKDRYQFARLLSQVAYVEDLVNSWAYTLQSLEAPSQQTDGITKIDEKKTSKDALVPSDDCMDKPSQSESIKENTEGLNDIAIDPDNSKEGDKCTENVASDVNGPSFALQTQGSTSFKDQPVDHQVNEPNGIGIDQTEPKSVEHSNGFMREESVDNGNVMNIDTSTDQVLRSSPTPSGLCSYRFCSECLSSLQSAMQKTLLSQLDVGSGNLTTEDVHDVVTSLSLNLCTSVREFCLSGDQDNIKTLFKEGMVCGCHSESNSGMNTVDSSEFSRHGLDSELVYKNGVLVLDHQETDVSFHCKFQKLCLCSLIEYIVKTKQPSG
ncbi:AAA+ ATPase domain-containing protein [Artemisia annua]|uniref:AAA+ ATPase domain-containing protein n=1 Tax=Artemisia annua TaxID=35608 RepID=A0A2U1Q478_ARTAN|nr:AAA+ ATPase domain-containing protein [Artemisia annua]